MRSPVPGSFAFAYIAVMSKSEFAAYQERYRRVYREVHGDGPYECYFCEEPIVLMTGLRSKSFIVHHRNMNRNDDSDENLVAAHSGCHTGYHNLVHYGLGTGAFSAEARAKVAAANTGKTRSAETRAKQSASLAGEHHPNFGNHLAPETRAKIATSLTGKKASPQALANRPDVSGEKNPFYGRAHTAEARARMSVSKKGTKPSAEARAKMSASQRKAMVQCAECGRRMCRGPLVQHQRASGHTGIIDLS